MAENDPVPPLFKEPATPANITALEERLEVTLPADYKEFLSITNGFGLWTYEAYSMESAMVAPFGVPMP